MGVVMLNRKKGNAQLLRQPSGHRRRIVAGMEIGHDEFRLYFQQLHQMADRFLQGGNRPHIGQIPNIRGRVKEIVFGQAEGAFQFAANGQHRPLKRP